MPVSYTHLSMNPGVKSNPSPLIISASERNPSAHIEPASLILREDDFRAYLKRLDGSKPVILCGDLNVAHEEIDLKTVSYTHLKPVRGFRLHQG